MSIPRVTETCIQCGPVTKEHRCPFFYIKDTPKEPAQSEDLKIPAPHCNDLHEPTGARCYKDPEDYHGMSHVGYSHFPGQVVNWPVDFMHPVPGEPRMAPPVSDETRARMREAKPTHTYTARDTCLCTGGQRLCLGCEE